MAAATQACGEEKSTRRGERVLCTTPGKEEQMIAAGAWSGNVIGVFTSGGDSQGMNGAVRAVVRMGFYLGCKVYFIKEGYKGMVEGGDKIVEATWASVSEILQLGGTVIGSVRCQSFRERSGRLHAALNLLHCGITNLVVIGGDGSLTGANLFRQEWTSLLQELGDTGKITEEDRTKYHHLNIVGIVGSIDNDFCGIDMTVGTDSALHRIIDAVDAISFTASSHQRAIVMELMGGYCGYLALVAALACEADWVFLPEWPPEADWETALCQKLASTRNLGQRLNIVLVAEGNIDRDGNIITADRVKNVITTQLNYNTRVTVLGNIQRGGSPSAFDRILGSRLGAEAVLALMDATADTPACVVSLEGRQTVRVPLVECVNKTKDVRRAMDEGNFEEAVLLRGRSFQNKLRTYCMLSKLRPPSPLGTEDGSASIHKNIAVMTIGAPACGMNVAVRAFVRLGLTQGYRVLGIQDSFDGLVAGKVHPIIWSQVQSWAGTGGSLLGTKKQVAVDVGLVNIAEQLQEFKIKGLLIIGGFEAFHSAHQLFEARSQHPAFCIPTCVIPCTISNNVPGTDFCLGVDTALNEIVDMCDRIRQSATGINRHVSMVETMGGHCGYLATMSALAAGADASYIFEEKITISDLMDDVFHLRDKILNTEVDTGLFLRNENTNPNYTPSFINQLFSEEGKGVFSVSVNVLGHMQLGRVPSPFDRNYGTKMAARCVNWFKDMFEDNVKNGCVDAKDTSSCVLLGMQNQCLDFTPIDDLIVDTDFENCLPRSQWWLKLRPLLRILANHTTKEPHMTDIRSATLTEGEQQEDNV